MLYALLCRRWERGKKVEGMRRLGRWDWTHEAQAGWRAQANCICLLAPGPVGGKVARIPGLMLDAVQLNQQSSN